MHFPGLMASGLLPLAGAWWDRASALPGARLRLLVLLAGIVFLGLLAGTGILARNLCAQKRAEGELRRLHRVLRTLTECDYVLLHAPAEQSLLEQICSLLVHTGGYHLAWIGWAEPGGKGPLRPVCHAVVDGFLGFVPLSWSEDELGRGAAGTAIRTRKPALKRDTAVLPGREQPLRPACASSLGLPLSANGKVFGVLTLYAAESDAFDAAGIELLTKLADNVSYGIQALRSRAQRERFAAALQRSNQELQDFASLASHDLQEPLRKIISFGERLHRHCEAQLDDCGHDYLARIGRAAARMSNLIESLLQYARVSTAEAPFEPVDLQITMFGVLSDLERRIQSSQARVLMGTLPILRADRLQMHILLLNLVSNALKFQLPDAIPKVEITAHLDGDFCELHVRDNGIGFEESCLDRIFLPLQRLRGRAEYEGSGMGLAICRKIALRHGGELSARSRPGHGSDFILRLPLRPQAG